MICLTMRIYVFCGLLILFSLQADAQNHFTAYIKDNKSNEPLIGAIVSLAGTGIGAAADVNGLVFVTGIPDGKQIIKCTNIGYRDYYDTLVFPLKSADTLKLMLEADNEEMEEVVVSTTRSTRTIQDVPTRIELVAGEELEEKSNMKPGDIKMVLSESTGIQTLQTSATSGNTGIRIEGMDGRYTQVLKDGFPLYAGFSGGLGLLQTPPLDLKRIEIVKGASSTLYGGGAIAGLINLISKTPGFKREFKALFNGTTAGGFDAGLFYSKRTKRAGITVYAAYDFNKAYSPDTTIFTAIPYFRRYILNPKLFWYPNEKTEVVFGVNGMYENRLGGDINYIKNGQDSIHLYHEDNKTERINTTLEVKRNLDDMGVLTLKNSTDHFSRVINTTGNTFDGTQAATFTEINYAVHKKKMEWVAGINAFTDAFIERKQTLGFERNYRLSTYGAFIQNTWDINTHFILETGLRIDYVSKYGYAALPRVSLLYKYGNSFSSRIGGGLGYKAPTLFTEESERLSYHNVLPINADSNKLERSYGGNWDVNYKTTFKDGKVIFSVNQ